MRTLIYYQTRTSLRTARLYLASGRFRRILSRCHPDRSHRREELSDRPADLAADRSGEGTMKINRDYVPRRRPRWAAAAILMGMHAGAGGVAQATEPAPIQLPNQTPRDFMTTNAARRAIQKDEQLTALNL